MVFGLVNGAILALNAIGVTVVYGAVRTLKLAHGDVFVLTSAMVTSTINLVGLNLAWPPPLRLFVLGAFRFNCVTPKIDKNACPGLNLKFNPGSASRPAWMVAALGSSRSACSE